MYDAHDTITANDGYSLVSETRDIPTEDAIETTFTAIANELADLGAGNALEPVIAELLARFTGALYGTAENYSRRHGELQSKIVELIQCQDGSEVKSVELEEARTEAERLDELIDAVNNGQEIMAQGYAALTGERWKPARGSIYSKRKNANAAVIEGREYLANREKAEALRAVPEGTKVAVVGTANYTDHEQAFEKLDAMHEKAPDMVLITGGQKTGIDKIAAIWAGNRNVPVLVVRPDFKRHGKAAAFKRVDHVLDTFKPAAVFAFQKQGDPAGLALNMVQKSEEHGVFTRRFGQKAD